MVLSLLLCTQGRRLGEVLAVLLRRMGQQAKVTDAVALPRSLAVGGQQYQLTGILVHLGDSGAYGHYYAYVQQQGHWVCCNDRSVVAWDPSKLAEDCFGGSERKPCATAAVYERCPTTGVFLQLWSAEAFAAAAAVCGVAVVGSCMCSSHLHVVVEHFAAVTGDTRCSIACYAQFWCWFSTFSRACAPAVQVVAATVAA
jgi:hypothetical protein